MKNTVKNTWVTAYMMMVKDPQLMMPFVVIAFLESLALLILQFSTRFPISVVMGPIVRKFFGDNFNHFPATQVILPRMFYYWQVAIYILIGIFMSAVTVNIFKNIKSRLPVNAKAMAKNAAKNYFRYFVYGVMMVAVMMLLQKADAYLTPKVMRLTAKFFPNMLLQYFNLAKGAVLFLSNIMAQALLITTVPVMVLEKKGFIKALGKSLYMGITNFGRMFPIVLVPFLAYFPLTLLKSYPIQIADKTFPEINVIITAIGIVITVFLDSFVIVCVSQYLWEYNLKAVKKAA